MSRAELVLTEPELVLPEPVERLRIRSADGSWLNAETFGPAGAPIVVLAHGWTCSTAFWAPVVHRLAADHRVIAYDQRGHGRSDIPVGRAGYTTRALAEDLQAVVTQLVPAGERAVLAGHSMGGMTIMAAGGHGAVAARTAAVLLCSTGPSDLSEHLRVLPRAVRPPALRRALHRHFLQSALPMGPVTALSKAMLKRATMGRGATAAQVAACAEIVHACPTGVRAGAARMLGELDVRPGLTMLEAPTAIVVGSHDKLTPPLHARAMHAALRRPDGLLELPGVGHMAPVERPDEVSAELRRLVRTHLTSERTEAA
ncbi:alpha/beta fold hydrolase [Kitasatospora kifunensis]|uniref:Pimeloyl-ACP methyl ester carboxylesterase n=1 Tax=Kitasatospora kifunensis TaxID=58351 RepID=A0A7W7R850_KITKI|nr:alpha/beta hydrolase [Kitasatospora kifunensis]MBB4926576.1 pimeloyl-ACP methyl ester carboxylesterase [Kitasatospora kifunensis]